MFGRNLIPPKILEAGHSVLLTASSIVCILSLLSIKPLNPGPSKEEVSLLLWDWNGGIKVGVWQGGCWQPLELKTATVCPQGGASCRMREGLKDSPTSLVTGLSRWFRTTWSHPTAAALSLVGVSKICFKLIIAFCLNHSELGWLLPETEYILIDRPPSLAQISEFIRSVLSYQSQVKEPYMSSIQVRPCLASKIRWEKEHSG